MLPIRSRRTIWRGRVVLFAVLLFAGIAPVAAQTCPSSDGAGYTYVFPASGPGPFNVASGQSLLIQSGTYTGGLEGPAGGGMVCVNAGATFQPAPVNNLSGAIDNYGTTALANVVFGAGANFQNHSGADFTFNNTNANGGIAITNDAGANMHVSGGNLTIPGNSTVTNNGTVDISPGAILDLQANSTVTNNGIITVNGGDLNSAGTTLNTGYIHDFGEIHVNSGTFTNQCSIVATAFINAASMVNNGHLVVDGDGPFTNNGALSQGAGAVIAGGSFTNNNNVSGAGRYYFTGNTLNQGPFNGTTGEIVFYDVSQARPPDIFDIQTVAPTNTVRISFDPPSVAFALANCTPIYPVPPEADVSVTKSAPVTALPTGASVTYTLTAANSGPDGAEGTLLTDTPDDGLTCTAVTCTGASGGASCPASGTGTGQLSIDNLLGAGVALDLPAGGQIVLELTCTVDATP